MQRIGKRAGKTGELSRRWLAGLAVAAVLLGAIALAGSAGGRVGNGATPPVPPGTEGPTMSYRMTIDGPGGTGPGEWIDVLSWSWGMSQSGTSSSGGGGGAGKVSIQDFSFTKESDKTSTKLMQACASGSHFQKVVIDFVVTDNKDPENRYMQYELTNVLVTSFQTGGSAGGDDRPTEQVTLNFEKIKVTYSGTEGEPDSEFSWNTSEGSA